MKQQTEMMRRILQNEVAQRIIDYVSPIYGESYVALWIFEVIGIVLSEAATMAETLRHETNPITTELLMDQWEDQYGLYRDSSLTMEQRRARLLDKIRYRAPANPKRLAAAMATVLGVPVEITERVAKNTFQVDILDSVSDFRKLMRAIEVLDAKKPAHLIYKIAQNSRVDESIVKLALATVQAETYQLELEAVKLTLQTTLERAIKLGAGLSAGETYRIETQPVTIDIQTDLERSVRAATVLTGGEEYRVDTIRQAARSAVEAAFHSHPGTDKTKEVMSQ